MRLGPGLTVVTGPNGAGKTNLLEALYFACTGRSCRTANEREVVRFGAGVTRLELDAERDGEAHRITVGFEPGEAKRLQVDGAHGRPADRRGGPPAGRRSSSPTAWSWCWARRRCGARTSTR